MSMTVDDWIMSKFPVFMNYMEPFTVLQRIAEIMEYTELLDKADQSENPMERLAFVTAFAITPYSNGGRPYKPFNPILGETFQLECNNGVQFLAEQVNCVPPIGVAHAENKHFTYDIVSLPQTQFRGNSIELYPYGRSHIKLKRTGEVFSIIPPKSKICRLIIGRTYIDNFGQLLVVNNTTQDRAEIAFKKRGWFGRNQRRFQGPLKMNTNYHRSEAQGYLMGKWDKYCDFYTHKDSKSRWKRIWQSSLKNPRDKFGGRSDFTILCTSCAWIQEPLKTDSRRRPDVAAIQDGRLRLANKEMLSLQKRQFQEQETRQKQYDFWKPNFFEKIKDGEVYDCDFPISIVPCYHWKGQFPVGTKPLVSDPGEVRGKGFSPWQYPESTHDSISLNQS